MLTQNAELQQNYNQNALKNSRKKIFAKSDDDKEKNCIFAPRD
jgi:hypothetical protein